MEVKFHSDEHFYEKNVKHAFLRELNFEMDKILGKGAYQPEFSIKNEQSAWCVDISIKSSRGKIAVLKKGTILNSLLDDALHQLLKKAKLLKEQGSVDAFRLNNGPEFEMFSAYKNGNLIERVHPLKVLIVEDDPVASHVINAMLKHIGCITKQVSEPKDAITEVESRNYDLMVLDWNLPYNTGKDLLLTLESKLPILPKKRMPVILCSGLGIEEIDFPAVKKLFLVDYWSKKVSFSSVVSSVEKTIKALESWVVQGA